MQQGTEAFDEFLALVEKRRSCRRFRPEAIPEGHVEKLLEAARWAMSGGNSQPVLSKNRKGDQVQIERRFRQELWARTRSRALRNRSFPGWWLLRRRHGASSFSSERVVPEPSSRPRRTQQAFYAA